jgi:hypothetical protein
MPNTYDFLGDYKGYFQKSSSQVYCNASGSLQYVGKTNHEVEFDPGLEYVEWFDNSSGTQSLYILVTDKVDPRVNFSWMQVHDPNTLPMVVWLMVHGRTEHRAISVMFHVVCE